MPASGGRWRRMATLSAPRRTMGGDADGVGDTVAVVDAVPVMDGVADGVGDVDGVVEGVGVVKGVCDGVDVGVDVGVLDDVADDGDGVFDAV